MFTYRITYILLMIYLYFSNRQIVKWFVHLKRSQSYLNFCRVIMSFIIGTEQSNKISFLDVNVISEKW